MQISPSVVIARIKAECPLLIQVGGGADFAAAKAVLKNKVPACFVVPLADQASPNSSATVVVNQRINQQFGVILAVSNLRDAAGEKAINDLFLVRQQLFQKLIGWFPAGAVSCMEFSGGHLLDMDDHVVWWQDNFNIDTYFRSA